MMVRKIVFAYLPDFYRSEVSHFGICKVYSA